MTYGHLTKNIRARAPLCTIMAPNTPKPAPFRPRCAPTRRHLKAGLKREWCAMVQNGATFHESAPATAIGQSDCSRM